MCVPRGEGPLAKEKTLCDLFLDRLIEQHCYRENSRRVGYFKKVMYTVVILKT